MKAFRRPTTTLSVQRPSGGSKLVAHLQSNRDRLIADLKALADSAQCGQLRSERKYDDLEKRLAALPVVTVPAITMEGDANGAAHPPGTAYRNKFSGKYDYRVITGGVGHNIPQGPAPESAVQQVVLLFIF